MALSIAQHQLEAFGRSNWIAFLAQATAHLHADFPAVCEKATDEQLHAFISHIADWARDYDIEEATAIMCLVDAGVLLRDPEFHKRPVNRPISRLLERRSLPGELRALEVLKIAHQRASLGATADR